MASKVMMSSSSASANSDLALQSSSLYPPPIQTYQSKNFGSISMEDLIRNIYGDESMTPDVTPMGNNGVGVGVSGGDGQFEQMTLETFLAKAGAVREEDVRDCGDEGVHVGDHGVFDVNSGFCNQFQLQQQQIQGDMLAFGNGVEERARGKRKMVQEEPVDKVTQQRQKRMIKNRESAARSRERKQHYTEELEALVAQLEEENTRLQRQQAIQSKERFKQLMENLIPVEEKIPDEKQRSSSRVLRRVRSMEW
ncbi:hypothetical protein GIB67_036120 [Kingdonia uniflora]|uniref:BZIP domain-containing protein n=1 Tax=Kingdonia uniflora TaxID=39325 RepID=A0A7J7N9J1_9MAGN|nr:hypothetical protein GIB67_036120 [Kingdonia uniflora]